MLVFIANYNKILVEEGSVCFKIKTPICFKALHMVAYTLFLEDILTLALPRQPVSSYLGIETPPVGTGTHAHHTYFIT